MNWLQKIAQTMFLPIRGGYAKVPGVYIRAGMPPTDESGVNTPSHNYLWGVDEKGVSVYIAWHDPKTGKYVLQSGGESMLSGQNETIDRPLFLVEGTATGYAGGDDEDLLDPATVKIIKQLQPDDIVFEQDPWMTLSGATLSEEETPDWSHLDVKSDFQKWWENNNPRMTY